MIIHPEIVVTPDRPVIRFREPREKIKLDEELPKILHRQGWSLGTFFDIEFINFEKTKLLSFATFVVIHEAEHLHVSEANPYQPMTKTLYNRKADQTTEWWFSGFGKEAHEQVRIEEENRIKKEREEKALKDAEALQEADKPVEPVPVKSNKKTKTAAG